MAQTDMQALLEGFERAMRNTYEEAGRLTPPYKPTYFLRMLDENGAKETADKLLVDRPNLPDGFIALWERGPDGLKISVEYLVLSHPWNQLFNSSQLTVAETFFHKTLMA